jgi:hypothetical protein
MMKPKNPIYPPLHFPGPGGKTIPINVKSQEQINAAMEDEDEKNVVVCMPMSLGGPRIPGSTIVLSLRM